MVPSRPTTNVSGTPLCVVDVGGKFGRDLATRGEEAMVDCALEWLVGLYGSNFTTVV